MATEKPRLSQTVVAIGWASLFTDFSGEMIYPLLPIFLAGTLGAGALSLGAVEGAAEATASLMKAVFGRLADRVSRRKPLVLAGYGISGIVRPLIGLAGSWSAVLAIRVADRFGKGVRGSPRDALIADVTPQSTRGRAYGFHQAMDHAGAVAGPLVAAWLLSGARGIGLRSVFLLAAVPGALACLAIAFGVREAPRAASATRGKAPHFSLTGLRELAPGYRQLLAAAFVFTLGNSTDAFLLLRLSGVGLSAAAVAALWAVHHVIKLLSTLVGGNLSDRFGPKPLMVAGWLWYAATYLAFALVSAPVGLIAVFLAYGVYFGLADPAQSALIASKAGPSRRGTAFGYFSLALGVASLPASLLFGWVAQAVSVPAAFGLGAGLAACGCALLSRV